MGMTVETAAGGNLHADVDGQIEGDEAKEGEGRLGEGDTAGPPRGDGAAEDAGKQPINAGIEKQQDRQGWEDNDPLLRDAGGQVHDPFGHERQAGGDVVIDRDNAGRDDKTAQNDPSQGHQCMQQDE